MRGLINCQVVSDWSQLFHSSHILKHKKFFPVIQLGGVSKILSYYNFKVFKIL